MKPIVLCGITLFAVAPAFAQTGASPVADRANHTVTLTGCVGGGTESKPITLSNALIVPATAQPGTPGETPSPVQPRVSSTETEPADPSLPPASPTGTSGTRTAPPSSVGTTGIVTGTAPAGSSGSTLTGYRLSGADMKPWLGQRVQLTGTFVPSAQAPSAPSPITGAAAMPPALEFKVQTVQPASGSCPKQ